jgi:hypothetical protein
MTKVIGAFRDYLKAPKKVCRPINIKLLTVYNLNGTNPLQLSRPLTDSRSLGEEIPFKGTYRFIITSTEARL